jgi:uncharacterized protein (DUF2147 family)
MQMFARALSVFSLLVPMLGYAADPDAIVGVWTTDKEKSKVEIFKQNDNYYGKIVALKEPLYPADPKHPDFMAGRDGQPKVDARNPDEALRSRPIIGMELMRGFTYGGDDVWSGGTIYDPESGKTYKCKLTLASPKELKVRGYIGISLLGRTTTWTR